ncbi:MAG TPA: hypothetical protein VMI54_02865 [Polyangiaceae bacterium]|nr:hypothetical protein [Polyangiaceae bacterium]
MANPYDRPPQAPFAGYGPEAYLPPSQTRQAILDEEHLRLLRIGYFISAGYWALFIPFGLVYAVMGLVFSHLPTGGGPPPPPFMLMFFGVFGATFAGIAALAAGMKLVTAIRLKERRSRTLCLVTAGLSCFEIPYGTALGIMTFTVLGRPSVRQAFEQATHVATR